MTNEQTAAYLASIIQRVKLAQSDVRGCLPIEELKPSEYSTAAKVQRVFYDLERDLNDQFRALNVGFMI